jgi:NADPH2:quinone reductase
VIGTVSSDAKAKLARHAGRDHVINYSSEDFVAEALAFTAGNGVAAVFDSVGADTFRGSLAVLRPRGTLVQFGNATEEVVGEWVVVGGRAVGGCHGAHRP